MNFVFTWLCKVRDHDHLFSIPFSISITSDKSQRGITFNKHSIKTDGSIVRIFGRIYWETTTTKVGSYPWRPYKCLRSTSDICLLKSSSNSNRFLRSRKTYKNKQYQSEYLSSNNFITLLVFYGFWEKILIKACITALTCLFQVECMNV